MKTLQMFRPPILLILQISFLLLVVKLEAKEAPRPNIIVMMADDMGWSDIGCYGSEIQTPNLDGLAENGVRFTQFYNTGRCCPTRASLLTGTYPHQAGIGWMMSNQNLPGYKGDLGKNVRTIAEVLKTAGYSTYMAGKWHVTPHVRPGTPKYNWPRQRGFDRFYGTIHGAGSFYDPNSLTRENTLISPLEDKEYNPDQYYYTHAISDHATRYIREHKEKNPFFMYVAHTAPHWPMHALEPDVKKYKGVYDKGWDEIRNSRYARQIKMGLIDKKWKMSPRDSKAPSWEDASDKEWDIRNMEVYAAMVDALDQGVGRIIKALKATNQFENTLFFFIADNGGCAEGMGRRSGTQYRDKDPNILKPMGKDELQLDMIPRRTRDGRVVKQGTEVLTGGPDTYHGYGLPWANASNTPFREYKHWVHEGGISSPLIAHWPAGIKKSRLGKLENQPGHLIDIMATAVDLAGAKYPKKIEDTKVVSMQGTSLAPGFNGKNIERKAPIFWEHEGNRAMRDGKWKLVAKGSNGPWELYDIEEDRTELNNLALKEAERLKSMSETWEAWALEAKAKPWPWGRKKSQQQKLSNKKSFKLKQGDDLPMNKAPNVGQKPFSINADVTSAGHDGVLIAQGGVNHGYALHLQDGILNFSTRHNGKLTIIAMKTLLPKEKTSIQLQLDKNGKVTLHADGKVTEGKVPGPMYSQPIDGLQVGVDLNGVVGEYKPDIQFRGRISNVQIRLLK